MSRRSCWDPRPVHYSTPKIDAEGFQIVCPCKRINNRPSRQDILQIKANSFAIVKTNSLGGHLFHLIERKPNLSRSIILPQNAVNWIRKTLVDTLDLHSLSQPFWTTKDGQEKFRVRILFKDQGYLLWLQEYLSDDWFVAICVPQGHRSSGWAPFQSFLQRHLHLPSQNHLLRASHPNPLIGRVSLALCRSTRPPDLP